jgi:valyl-tRNA synthetase
MKAIPFRFVHVHGIVRDAGHKKMSKTLGNVIEPLELIDEFGADAVRFTLSSMAVPGTDIPFSSDRMKGYGAFANKAWNAARFVLMNLKEEDVPVTSEAVDDMLAQGRDGLPLEDRWILHRLNQTAGEISSALDKYRFHEASNVIYQFFWHELCDWYIELVKPILAENTKGGELRKVRAGILIYVLDQALRLLHPFMPFITEEIWQRIPHTGDSIMTQEFPRTRPIRADDGAQLGMQKLMDLTVGIRSARAEMNIEPKKVLDATLVVTDADVRKLVESNLEKVRLLARLGRVAFAAAPPAAGVQLKGVWKHGEFRLDLQGVVDFHAERERLQKELARIKSDIQKIVKKLNSHEFMDRAPDEVVQENRARHADLLERLGRLESNLQQLPPE